MKRIFRTVAFALALGAMSASFVACEEEEGTGLTDPEQSITESIDFSNFKAVAKADGKIEIQGQVIAQGKIKSLEIIAEDGKTVIADLLKVGDQQKVKEIDEAGEKQVKFTLDIPTTPVDVQIMQIVGKTRGGKEAKSEIIGQKFEVEIGSASNATLGSYLSMAEGKVYMMGEAKADPSKIDVIALSDGQKGDKNRKVIGIQRASAAADADIATGAGKTAMFDGAGAKIEDGTSVTAGTIITASNTITTFKLECDGDKATMSGVTIKNSAALPLDVTAFAFSK